MTSIRNIEEAAKSDLPDDEIYESIRSLVHGKEEKQNDRKGEVIEKIEKGEPEEKEEKIVNYNVGVYDKSKLRARGEKHARAICDVLPRYDFRPRSLLDVGCADGAITTALMERFNIRPEDAYGCDISPLTSKG